MMKFTILVITCILLLALLAGIGWSQEVYIPDFPLGIGGSVSPDQFKPYYADLKLISDTLQKYPLARAIITGGADGELFWHNNDAQNPGLALGRAHVLRNLLMEEFGVEQIQIVIQSKDSKMKGPRYRNVTVRIDRELSDLDARLQKVENRHPPEGRFTEVKETPGMIEENFGVQFGLGLSTSPFGAIPMAEAALTWRRIIYVEGVVGHTLWNNSFRFENTDLDTKRRLIGGRVIVYPLRQLPLGIVGGWTRMEEISQDYYEYTRLSEGPMIGLRVVPLKFLSLTAAYHPSKSRIAGEEKSDFESDRFLAYITAHIDFGGQK